MAMGDDDRKEEPGIYEPFEVSGFDVVGYELPGGKIRLAGTNRIVEAFHEAARVNGVVYTLENVQRLGYSPNGKFPLLNAQYA